ncbi:N-acetylglucosamine kinase-like BadF-type ATPase [Kibdelosporangium banguiense]|uniref:N-acetylglucosamine kinase-like BadF-type ATPase n=1 Tax=Kibdelosporangium banguiense TaxID=1365924 RepID=A0ABS4TMH1_9PSEU|nr:BadF/BadG/BcrA/BcrD ATPase family protein [Kibdelosporangium banguiense]MBP2325612.1 N-acetylglucosamine kinase-like BadF-type ATPase [Kibdelosporangium banguiense]
MNEDAVIIAIDGGGSKTDVLLVDASGAVLGRSRGAGASPQVVGMKPGLDVFESLVAEAAVQAGLPATPPFGTHTSAYLAGADLPAEEEELFQALTERGWSESVVVGNDTFALLRAGTTDGVGVAVVCGAGINCVGVSADGRVHRFPALGRISGDWGGGFQLGSEALWWAVRDADGRGPRTELLPAVVEHFGARDIFEVVERLHFKSLPRQRIHELSPLLFRIASAGDTIANRVVQQLVDEVATMVSVTVRELGMTGEAPVVVLGGGVLTGVDSSVIAQIAQRCVDVAPRADVRVVDIAPVVGAALLGLDAIGAPAAAKTRLRASAGLLSSVPAGVIGQSADGLVNGGAPSEPDGVGKRPERFGAS